MSEGPKVVLVGAASTIFGPTTLRDLLLSPQLEGGHIALVDVAEEGLASVLRFGQRLCEALGRQCTVSATPDRRAALEGADFVVVSVARDRERTWKLDFDVPLRMGVRHVLGENGGPGGLFHSLRNIPLLLDIARDVEALAPNAWLINFTNPMPSLCMALARHSRMRFVGLCHQLRWAGYKIVAEVLGVPEDDLRILAAGLNHFTWMLAITHAHTGQDLYPAFREALNRMPPDFEPLSRELYDVFGLFPAAGDGHAGEYIAHAWQYVGTQGYDWDWYHNKVRQMRAEVDAVISGDDQVTQAWLAGPSLERAQQVIGSLSGAGDHAEEAVNVVNGGAISNLPRDAVVEVPAHVCRDRVLPMQVGPLPPGIAQLCGRQVAIQELVVQAAVHGDRSAALQALVLDPLVPDVSTARRILEALLREHAAYLPQFG